MAEKSRVTTPRGRHESWCQASAVRGCVPILINPEFDAALDRNSCVTHWMSSPGSALWYTDIWQSFFFFFFFLSFRECCLTRQWQSTECDTRYMVQRKKFDVILRFLVDRYRRTKPPKPDTSQVVVPWSSATSKSGNRFGWSFFFAVWRRCARSQLHMNSVPSFSWRVKEAALWKFGSDRTAPKICRRENMIFTVHLNRLIDENTPLDQSTIETCQQEAHKYQKVTKISCDIGSRLEASWLDCVAMMSEMTIAVIVVSASCHQLTRADSGWSRLITNILIQSRDLAMIARWHQCGTMTSQILARASFSPSVWPSSRSNFDLGPSPSDSTEKTLSYQSLWFWSAVFL